MAINATESCTVVTGPHIELMRWVTIKHGLKLEKTGMKPNRFWKRSNFAAVLGVKPRASIDDYIKAVEAKIGAVSVAANAQEAATKSIANGEKV